MTVHEVSVDVQAKTTPLPGSVDANDPPTPVVVATSATLMLCPVPCVIVHDVAPQRLIPTMSPTAEAAGREKDRAPPEVHKNPDPRTRGFDELTLSQTSIFLKFGMKTP
jgi:hypothetical protein